MQVTLQGKQQTACIHSTQGVEDGGTGPDLALLEHPLLGTFGTQLLNVLEHVEDDVVYVHYKEQSTHLSGQEQPQTYTQTDTDE